MRIKRSQHPHLKTEVIDIFDGDHIVATISLFGAHLIHWQPNPSKQPLLWMSDASYKKPDPIRGGIPICFPWFGSKHGHVNHGWARVQEWQLGRVSANSQSAMASISIQLLLQVDSFNVQLEIVIIRGDQECSLSQYMEIQNCGDQPEHITAGFHTYFRVSSVATLALPGLANCDYYDKSRNCMQKASPFVFSKELVDRVYENDSPLEFEASEYQVTVSKKTLKHWVVWNPGPEVARFSDINPEQKDSFICIEPASIHPITIAPGHYQSFAHSIEVT